MSGLFVAFEGGEGAGKSTQITMLARHLRATGWQIVETREPGGTPLGAQLRHLVLDPDGEVTPRAETLLYAADRAQHVDTVIVPALQRGAAVLSDRFVDSTLAYQGAGRGLGDGARTVTTWTTGGLLPDLTVLLDIDPQVGLARASARGAPDRLENASLDFHNAVRDGFLLLALAEPHRYLVLDATQPPGDIAGTIHAEIDARATQ